MHTAWSNLFIILFTSYFPRLPLQLQLLHFAGNLSHSRLNALSTNTYITLSNVWWKTINIHACMKAQTHTQTHTNTHKHTQTHTHAHTVTHTYIQIFMYIYIHLYIYFFIYLFALTNIFVIGMCFSAWARLPFLTN